MDTTPAQRDANGRFIKGQSGNISGRPTGLREIAELARSKVPRCIELLMQIAENKNEPVFARLAAIQEINNRGLGKAPVSIAMDVATVDMTRIHETALLMKELGSFSVKREVLLPPPVIEATHGDSDDH